MSHLALWRNIDDEGVAVQLAVEVGSPEMLQMLLVMTCADLAAVGPGVLNQWKLKLISDLYERTMRQVAGESAPSADERLGQRRRALRERIAGDNHAEWWDKQIDALPASLLDDEGDRVLADLKRLESLPRREAQAWGRYDAVGQTVEYTIGTYEDIAPGIFHRLTGCLSSQGLQILTAEIHTLADSLVLDRFHVYDPDYSGEPPPHRLDDVNQALVAALKDTSGKSPSFRRTWQQRSPAPAGRLPTRVRIDNSTSERFTIVDVFANDRLGLLYTITRTLFELGLSVGAAKIGTRVDQVVDVFYVTDQQGQKIEDEERILQIRDQLLEAIGQVEGA
jgi:[protein-PII] uridylyltransferase